MPTAAEVFREFIVDGDAGSGQHHPDKAEIITWGTGLEGDLEVKGEKDEEQDERLDEIDTTLDGLQQAIIDVFWRVGDLYFTSNPTMPPAFLENDRTWELYAAGRAIVGVGSADGVSWAGGQTRGEALHTLTPAEMARHRHSLDIQGNTEDAGKSFDFSIRKTADGSEIVTAASGVSLGTNNNNSARLAESGNGSRQTVEYDGEHDHDFTVSGNTSFEGNNQAHNNLQPSIAVYIFKRTA